MVKPFKTIWLSLALTLSLASTSAAQDWNYTVTPYLWAPALNLNLDVGPNPPVSGETNVLEVIDGALLLQGEARRGKWSILGEFNYLNLSDDFGEGPGGVTAGWRVQGTMIALAAAYAVHENKDTRVDVLGGVRAWNLDTTTTVGNAKATKNSNFIDPMIGVRFETPFGKKAKFSGLFNIGGGNFGSDRQLETTAQIKWPVRDTMTFALGYRYLSLDFDEDNVIMDASLSGPFAALSFNF
ncbi:MAG: hypothetical protein ABJL72_17850 [Roseobacter sp.]